MLEPSTILCSVCSVCSVVCSVQRKGGGEEREKEMEKGRRSEGSTNNRRYRPYRTSIMQHSVSKSVSYVRIVGIYRLVGMHYAACRMRYHLCTMYQCVQCSVKREPIRMAAEEALDWWIILHVRL